MKPIIAIFLILMLSCTDRGNKPHLKYQQYAMALQRSDQFSSSNDTFKTLLNRFVDTVVEYNHGTDSTFNPFYSNNTRSGPTVIEPYYLNSTFDKIIVMVLTRGDMINGDPCEKIQYVLGYKENGKWYLKKQPGSAWIFFYKGGYPIMSEVEISLNMTDKFVSWGLMSGLEIQDGFFSGEWSAK